MDDFSLPENTKKQSIEGLGGFLWESGVYDTTVKMVYLDQAASKAISFNVVLEGSDGRELKEAFYIKSGDKKGNKTYYTKDKVNYPLPGYSLAESLCVAAGEESLAKTLKSAEQKVVKIYDHEAKKEVPKERPVVMSLIGKKVKVAVHQLIEDKNEKNEAGQWVPSGKTRSKNECKFFGNMEGQTAEEILEGSEPSVFEKWADKNTGKVVDKSTKTINTGGAATIGADATPAEPVANMFD